MAQVGATTQASPYAPRFAQGANLVPRLLFRIEPDAASALGTPAGRRALRSQRTVSEKLPWKTLPPLTGAVESQFVWPTILGEHLLPFRVEKAAEFVLPFTQSGEILDPAENKIDRWPGLATWMRSAEAVWQANQDGKLTLADQIDHMKKLSQQAPMPAVRVIYAASGMHVSAAVLRDTRVVIEHSVYWATAATSEEADFLVGILNSPSLTDLVRPYMSYGKDERHIDKSVWKLPIPTFDDGDEVHVRVATLASQLAVEIAALNFATTNFVTRRRAIREHLAKSEAGAELDAMVAELVAE